MALLRFTETITLGDAIETKYDPEITNDEIQLKITMFDEGRYRLTEEETAKAVGVEPEIVLNFLKSDLGKSLMEEHDYISQQDGKHFLLTKVVAGFWIQQAMQGNDKAIALIVSCVQGEIAHKSNTVFGSKYLPSKPHKPE